MKLKVMPLIDSVLQKSKHLSARMTLGCLVDGAVIVNSYSVFDSEFLLFGRALFMQARSPAGKWSIKFY